MKKGLIMAAAVYFVIVIIAFPTVYITAVNANKEEISITEEVISGSPLAAEGITLSVDTHYKGHMLWNTIYTIGSGESAQSSFRFASNEVRWENERLENVFIDSVSDYGTVSVSGSTRVQELDLSDCWFSEMLADVAEKTATGTTNTETVRLSEYYEYYPVTLQISSGKRNVYFSSDREDADITKLFHIKTDDKDLVTASITKNEEGLVTAFNIRNEENSGFVTEDAEAFGTDGLYYAYACTANNTGEYISRGENSGIFYIPYEADGSGRSRKSIAKDKIEKVCEAETGEVPVKMLLDEENERLYMLVRNDNGYNVHVYKLYGYVPKLVDTLEIPDKEAKREAARMTREDGGILIKWEDNSFVFINEGNKKNEVWCMGTFPYDDINNSVFYNKHSLLFDGERLVLTAMKSEDNADVELVVYGRNGQEYHGVYHHSLYDMDEYFYKDASNYEHVKAWQQSIKQ